MQQHEYRGMDIKALKSALRNRDVLLEEQSERIRELERECGGTVDKCSAEVSDLTVERNELKALLAGTLKRLETLTDTVHRSSKATYILEDKYKKLERERAEAVEAAEAAASQLAAVQTSHAELVKHSQLLEKISEVQLRHNRRKAEVFRAVLNGRGIGEEQESGLEGDQ